MSRTEAPEQFHRLPADAQGAIRTRGRLESELTPEQIAEFEERAERLRRHPEKGMTWERVCAELKGRSGKNRAGAER